MNRTISNMAALIFASNVLLLTGGVSAQINTKINCIFYSDNNYGTINDYLAWNNDWTQPIPHDIKSVRVRQGCLAAFQLFHSNDGRILQQRSTDVSDSSFHIPTKTRLPFHRVRTACYCQDHCIETAVEYGQEKNTNQRSSSACLNRGDIISIHNLGETTFDNNLGFVTIKADRWYDFNNDLPLPKYEIRAYQHPSGTGVTLDTHVMQAQNLLSGNGRTWWAPEDVKFSASSLYIERTF